MKKIIVVSIILNCLLIATFFMSGLYVYQFIDSWIGIAIVVVSIASGFVYLDNLLKRKS